MNTVNGFSSAPQSELQAWGKGYCVTMWGFLHKLDF